MASTLSAMRLCVWLFKSILTLILLCSGMRPLSHLRTNGSVWLSLMASTLTKNNQFCDYLLKDSQLQGLLEHPGTVIIIHCLTTGCAAYFQFPVVCRHKAHWAYLSINWDFFEKVSAKRFHMQEVALPEKLFH